MRMNDPKTLRRHTPVRILVVLALPAVLAGCAMVSVESTPPGAEVVCSPTGMPPWKPWPGGIPERKRLIHRVFHILHIKYNDTQKPTKTPAKRIVRAERYYFLRVHKDGYFPVKPAFVDVGPFRRQRFVFHLQPTPETFARLQRERGFVFYKGRWVKPQAEGLVEYKGKWMRPEEKFRLEQQAKGLVFYEAEGRWVTPAEKERLEAERMRAKGFVRFKGRWVSPQEAELERLIDRQAERFAASSKTLTLRVERIGPVFSPNPQLRVADLSGHPLELLLSGPQSHRVRVEPYKSVAVQTLPGTYTLVLVEADRKGVPPAVGVLYLLPKNRYSANYRGIPLFRVPKPPVPGENSQPGPLPGQGSDAGESGGGFSAPAGVGAPAEAKPSSGPPSGG